MTTWDLDDSRTTPLAIAHITTGLYFSVTEPNLYLMGSRPTWKLEFNSNLVISIASWS